MSTRWRRPSLTLSVARGIALVCEDARAARHERGPSARDADLERALGYLERLVRWREAQPRSEAERAVEAVLEDKPRA